MPICSIFTSSPEHPQDMAAHRGDLLKMLRWQRCMSAHCYILFCYSHLDKQGGFGCRFDFLLPPEMCPDGCAGDGCLRNQQNSSCLGRAESLLLPRAGKMRGRYKCSLWKVKGFSALHTAGDAAPKCCQPGPGHPRRSLTSLQAEGKWIFNKWTFYCIKQFSLCFYVEIQMICNSYRSLSWCLYEVIYICKGYCYDHLYFNYQHSSANFKL